MEHDAQFCTVGRWRKNRVPPRAYLYFVSSKLAALKTTISLAASALRYWTARQLVIAIGGALAVGLLIGIATVLIPNPWFGRDVPPTWWAYPVWVLTAIFSGLLLGTYAAGADTEPEGGEPRMGRWGLTGGMLAWFAVGCPVCNKFAILALGYTGAMTWFAPVQPLLGVVALIATGGAALYRLRGQVACPTPVLATAN